MSAYGSDRFEKTTILHWIGLVCLVLAITWLAEVLQVIRGLGVLVAIPTSMAIIACLERLAWRWNPGWRPFSSGVSELSLSSNERIAVYVISAAMIYFLIRASMC